MRVTYIFLKDSTLMAFEGPEEPVKSFDACHYISAEHEFKQAHFEWQEAMSTARESSLPVVNCECKKHNDILTIRNPEGRPWHVMKEGETIALPGWGLEKTYQLCPSGNWNECSKEQYERERNGSYASLARQAYRLKRSESEKKHDPATVKINVKSEKFKRPLPKKPENSTHGYTEGAYLDDLNHATAEAIRPLVEPSESQEEMLQELLQMHAYTGNNVLEKFTITRK